MRVNTTEIERAHRTVAVVSSLMACAFAAMLCMARRVIGDSPMLLAGYIIGVLFLVVNLPSAAETILGGRRRSLATSHATLAVGALSVVLAVGYLPARGAIMSGRVLAVVGWALFAFNLAFLLPRRVSGIAPALLLAGFAIGYGTTLSVDLWGQGYLHPLLPDKWAFSIHLDTLYHASVANMIHTYGVISSGLDGLPTIRYHVASHWMLAQLSDIFGLSVLQTYSFAYGLIFIPLFFFSLLTFAVTTCTSTTDPARGPHGSWHFWLLTFIGTADFLPSSMGHAAMAAWMPWVSESYTIALTMLLWSGAIVYTLWLELERRPAPRSTTSALVVAAFLAQLYAWCGLSKLSLLLPLLAMVLYGAARTGTYRVPAVRWTLVFISALFVGLWQMVRRSRYPEPHFLGGIFGAFAEWWPYFVPLYYLWLLVLIAVRLRSKAIGKVGSLLGALRAGELLDLELLVVGAAIGCAPGLGTDIDSVDFYYLSSFPRWLAIGLLLSTYAVHQRHENTLGRLQPIQRFGWNCLAACLLVAELAKIPPAFTAYREMTNHYATTVLQQRSAEPQPMVMKRRLEELARLPRSVKRRSFVFVPRSNQQYWGMHADRREATAPFFVPAVTGMALLYGVDDLPALRQMHDDGAYSLAFYTIPTGHRQAFDLCGRAHAFGGIQVFVLDSDETHTLDCEREP